MVMQYSVCILDSRNSFLRSFTPGPLAIYLSVTNSICSELFLYCFLLLHLSIHNYFVGPGLTGKRGTRMLEIVNP